MKIIRYSTSKSSLPQWGYLENDEVHPIQGDPLTDFAGLPSIGKLASVKLLAPCRPTKVVCAAINFHGAKDWEAGMSEPLIFLKAPSSITNPNEDIVSPITDRGVWGEAELTIVIGKRVSHATTEEAQRAIFGYTIGNDVSCDNTGSRDHHLARSKAADSFCPLGPYIDTEYNFQNKVIKAIHNGRVVRQGNTRDFFWDPIQLVEKLSQWMTLEPWDIILTGSPPMLGDVSYLQPGDRFEACVEGFPSLHSGYRLHSSSPLNAGKTCTTSI